MRKTSILNTGKLNHKLQAHARVCKENKKKDCPLTFLYQKINFEEQSRITLEMDQNDIYSIYPSSRKYIHTIVIS